MGLDRRRILLSVILGLATTITSAIALPIALYRTLPVTIWHRGTVADGPLHGWAVMGGRTILNDTVRLDRDDQPLHPEPFHMPTWSRPPRDLAGVDCVICETSGLPWYALSCESMYTLRANRGGYQPARVTGGIELSRTSGRFGVVPLRPVWDGLLADAAAWSAAWWGVFWTAARLRTWRASRHAGRCPTCGYDLSGLPSEPGKTAVCPECGRDAARAAPA